MFNFLSLVSRELNDDVNRLFWRAVWLSLKEGVVAYPRSYSRMTITRFPARAKHMHRLVFGLDHEAPPSLKLAYTNETALYLPKLNRLPQLCAL
jgi:hypothetical protein